MLSDAILIEEKDIHKVKALLSIRLHEKGITQSEISSILGITQPMVSKYILQKDFPIYISKIVDKLVQTKEKTGKIKFAFVAMGDSVSSSHDYYLTTSENIRMNEKSHVIQNILDALGILHGRNLANIVPNVKMNLAMSLKNPSTKDHIASIPGGLITINSQFKKFNEPEFGSSRHLSQILLYIHSLCSEIHAVLNIKYSQEILKKIKKHKFAYNFFSDNYTVSLKKNFDLLIHRGSFGIEPICYIFGKDAVDAVEKCSKLIGG